MKVAAFAHVAVNKHVNEKKKANLTALMLQNEAWMLHAQNSYQNVTETLWQQIVYGLSHFWIFYPCFAYFLLFTLFLKLGV